MIITLCNTRPSPAAVGHLSRSPLKLSSSPLAVTGWEQVLTSPHQPRQLAALQPPAQPPAPVTGCGRTLQGWQTRAFQMIYTSSEGFMDYQQSTLRSVWWQFGEGVGSCKIYYYWLHRQHWAMSHGGSAHARHNSSALPCHMCCAVLPCLLPGCCSSLL